MTTVKLLVNVDVADLDEAVDFYVGAFELRIGRRFADYGVELVDGSAPIYLLARAAATPASACSQQLRDYRRHWTPVHLDFVVEDVAAALRRAVAAGADLEGEVETHAWGRIAHLADPFGNGFCILQFLNRGYDEIAD